MEQKIQKIIDFIRIVVNNPVILGILAIVIIVCSIFCIKEIKIYECTITRTYILGILLLIISIAIYCYNYKKKKKRQLRKDIKEISNILLLDKWKNIGAKCFIYEVDILFLESNFDAEINKFNFSKEKDILFELRKMSKFFKFWRESFTTDKFSFVQCYDKKYFINNNYIESLIENIQKNGINDDNYEEYDNLEIFLKSHDYFYNFVCHLNKLQKLINKKFNGKIKTFRYKFMLEHDGRYDEDGEDLKPIFPEEELKEHIIFWKYENL